MALSKLQGDANMTSDSMDELSGSFIALQGAGQKLASQMFDISDTFKGVIGSGGGLEPLFDGISSSLKKLSKGMFGLGETAVGLAAAAVTGGLSLVLVADGLSKLADPLEAATDLLKGFATTIVKLAGSASPAGLQAVEESWNLISAKLGENLAPILVVVAASILTLGDYLNELFTQFESGGSDLTEVFDVITDGLATLGDAFLSIVEDITTTTASIWDLQAALLKFIDKATFGINNLDEEAKGLERGRDRALDASRKIEDLRMHMLNIFGKGTLREDMRKNMEKVKSALAANTGDKGGQEVSIADMWSRIQAGAMQDPIKQETLATQLRTEQKIQRLIDQGDERRRMDQGNMGHVPNFK